MFTVLDNLLGGIPKAPNSTLTKCITVNPILEMRNLRSKEIQ